LEEAPQALYDPRNGDLALPEGDAPLPERTNYFTVCWVREGSGTFWADSGCHRFGPQSLLFAVPYQNVRLAPDGAVRGVAVQSHANFLCIETCHHEVGCNGVLFNVANSPVMNFFYADAGNDKEHKNPEGALVPANREWHEANRTYPFAWGLGAVIVAYGLMIAAHPWQPRVAAAGSFLVFVTSFVTLSFLVTTPECWVPSLGDAQHGFPYLSGPGRLVLKDAIMLGSALVTMADSAKAYLRRSQSAAPADKVEVREAVAV
jgi:uncharacterized membrane protein YkgB